MRIYISYGFLSSKLNGMKMRKLLRLAGYDIAGSDKDVDIILAHSAGCWSLSNEAKPKLVLYVGLPLAAPGVKASVKNNLAVARDFARQKNLIHAFRYYLLGLLHALTQPRRNLNIIKNAPISNFINYKDAKTLMIINKYDTWPDQQHLEKFAKKYPRWVYISLGGSHDHIWQHPEEYVKIIDKYAKQLA